VTETFKEANVKAEEKQHNLPTKIKKKEDSRRLEHPPTAESPELDKIKIEFYKALKEFEGTDPIIPCQIPKQECSGS